MTDPDRGTNPPPSRTGPPPRAPLALLGLLTLATFAGPFAILMTIKGGARPDWPPDRPVEWVAMIGVSVLVVSLMAACLTSGIWARGRAKP